MKKIFTRAFVPMLLLTAGSYAHTASAGIIDLSGKDSDGTPNTFIYNESQTGSLDSISFDLNVEHFGTSWGSETRISLAHESGFDIEFEGYTDFGWGTTAGLYNFVGDFAIAGGPANASGVWTVSLYEIWDDAGIDSTFGSGSLMTLNISDVPEPGIIGILGLGLFAMRRRFT
ncbi:PEP-CTERM sorting domain-containing protein [Aliiglaciecola sp. 2_MG-2023]|uniref:PEP-CTERM sorting domain-containing protein n=1 Tax=unclassified Aliiglaciecola TaxID=2593648 RepID=UPI0026E12ED0|nr:MULTISPECIES: PEP-CTERM sorting domain-containing protein [unclassified Aliiglaciecola]MDO6709821.1 PEP-CTERM sorting domain-containing protein [Aliiglaciecola sp. 2_MG-2023]MDO6750637.1 PEP-CTERM sorting domain-containing protein [Aliiglaciecola sp. 1_MG-2023]